MWRRQGVREQPSWPERAGRPRVLVEDHDGATRTASIAILQRAGYDAAGCPGPAELAGGRCPLVDSGKCALAQDADAIVCSLRLSARANADVLRAHRRAHPSVPVIVEVTGPQAKALGHLLDGCRQVAFPFTRSPLLSAVADAVSAQPATRA
jgi:DNA-binding NtrC family response regulator